MDTEPAVISIIGLKIRDCWIKKDISNVGACVLDQLNVITSLSRLWWWKYKYICESRLRSCVDKCWDRGKAKWFVERAQWKSMISNSIKTLTYIKSLYVFEEQICKTWTINHLKELRSSWRIIFKYLKNGC